MEYSAEKDVDAIYLECGQPEKSAFDYVDERKDYGTFEGCFLLWTDEIFGQLQANRDIAGDLYK